MRLAVAVTVALVLGTPAEPLAAAQSRRSSRPSVAKVAQAGKRPAARKRSGARKPVASRATRRYSAAASRARAARVASARAAAVARTRETQTPRFKLDDLGEQVPDVRAAAAIIYNPETNQVLWESNSQDQLSIASITKVMTALVFLESGMPLSTRVNVQRSDVYRASTTYIRVGYEVTADDLLNLLLIGSDNAAARALARVSPYGASGFVDRMNQKAAELGLERTHYADPSGLLASNVSSAYDMARLIAFVSADERMGSVMRKAKHTVYAGNRQINVSSTNHLVRSGEFDVVGGKTGFISRSGYCLATMLRLPRTGQKVAVVVLGARSNQGRFWETRHLFNWMSTHTQKLLNMGAQPQPQPRENDAAPQ